MSTDNAQASGCGSAIIGCIVLAIIGGIVASLIPVYCEWQSTNNFETARAYVLGIPAGRASGRRGIHRELMQQTQQRKLMVVIAVMALIGAVVGKAIGASLQGNPRPATSHDSRLPDQRSV